MKIKFKGADQMVRNIQTIAKQYPDLVEKAIYREAQIDATEMKRRCPVDVTPNAPHPGNLRNSIHVEEPERHGKKIVVTTATGAQAPYAIYVHENPDAFHPVGEWKFMESVVNESRPFMAARIARRVHFDRIKL